MVQQERVLTVERLKELLHYDPETGLFLRLASKPKSPIGSVAGNKLPRGYIEISIDGKSYYGHRLAWFYVYGAWPAQLDHANRNTSDNRLSNLREATVSQNLANRRSMREGGRSYKGVSWDKRRNRWYARVQVNAVSKHIGYFHNETEAAKAYDREAILAYGEYAFLNFPAAIGA